MWHFSTFSDVFASPGIVITRWPGIRAAQESVFCVYGIGGGGGSVHEWVMEVKQADSSWSIFLSSSFLSFTTSS